MEKKKIRKLKRIQRRNEFLSVICVILAVILLITLGLRYWPVTIVLGLFIHYFLVDRQAGEVDFYERYREQVDFVYLITGVVLVVGIGVVFGTLALFPASQLVYAFFVGGFVLTAISANPNETPKASVKKRYIVYPLIAVAALVFMFGGWSDWISPFR